MANVDKTLSNEYTSNIGQRLFAYTYHGNVINETIANQFKKSLIFLGYEGQIWSPLTNTYVGIGKTAYDITTAYTVLAHEKIDALNTALTSSLVSGIYANWGEDDWATAQGIGENGLPSVSGDNAWNTKIGASNKIVIKGIGDYDTVKDQRMDAEYAHVTDQNATEEERAKLLAAKIPFTTYSQWATSGITVSLEKGENEYRWERLAQNIENGAKENVEKGENGKVVAWVKGKTAPADGDDFTWDASLTKDPAQPMSMTHYVRVFNAKNEQVYRNGKNVISIDDKQTWSYITARTTYAMDFAKEYTNSEVNRIYAEILGLQQGQIIPVSYNHIWEIAANKDALNNVEGDSYVAVALPADKIYLEKVQIANETGLSYNTTDKTITVDTLGTVNSIDTLIANWATIREAAGDYYVMGLDEQMGETKAFITDDRKHTDGNLNDGGATVQNQVTLYNLKYVYKVVKNIANVTAGGEYVLVNQSYQSIAENVNLADGINTLKEVAHVLDLITNGSMDPTNPENAGIELAYSIAQNHVDIVELDKRLDKLEAGENAVRSLQEVVNGPHLDLHLASAVENGGKYYQDVTISATLNMAYTHSADDTIARETIFVPTWNANADNGDITLSYTVDGPTTVSSLVDRTHEGLVTTSWALSYGVELRQAIVANDIELNKHLAYAHSYALINALDGTYTTSKSKLVCGYTQTNGKVEVSYRELPTDHIEASATIWGESGDTALKVYAEVANNVVTEAIARQTPLFTKVANGEYLKLTDAECGAVTDGTVVTFFALKDGVMVAITNDNFGGSAASDLTRRVKGLDHKDHIVAFKQIDKYVRVDSADLTIDADGKATGIAQLYTLAETGQPADQVKYISATAVHHNDETYADNDGSNTFRVTAHITKISDATETNSGLADAYDVKNAIDNIFGWVDLSEWASNNPLNRTDAPAQP